MKLQLVVIIASALLGTVASAANASYNVDAAMAWLDTQGCDNKTIGTCPGDRLCTDAEFYARTLAAGGVIKLDPNGKTNGGAYANYTFNNKTFYNLALSPGLIDFLTAFGFSVVKPTTAFLDGSVNGKNVTDVYPKGAIVFTKMYPPGMPFVSLGEGSCSSHTPIVAHGPHCGMPCAYFIPRIAYMYE